MSDEKIGELEKQIEAEIKKAKDFVYSSLGPQNPAEMAGLLDPGLLPNVKQILEAMWKEFPACPKITGYTLTMWKNEVDLWLLRWKGNHDYFKSS